MECSICLEAVNNENIIYLDCQHFFHKCCLYKLESSKCPLCRTSIRDINETLNDNVNVNDINYQMDNNFNNLVCCPSRCPNGYSPFQDNGECRYCYGKNIPDCV